MSATPSDDQPLSVAPRRRVPPSLKLVLASGVLGICLVSFSSSAGVGWVLLNFYLFCILEIILVVPHELAHALTAKALGMRVFRVRLGVGQKIVSFRLFGWDWEIHSVLMGGATQVSARSREGYRTRHALVTLAGPMLNLLVLVWFVARAFQGHALITAFSGGLCPLSVFAAANLVVLLNALWPRAIVTPGGDAASDGLALLQLPGLTDEQITTRLVLYFSLEGGCLRRAGRNRDAMATYDLGLQVTGEDPLLVVEKSALLTDQGQYVEARELLRSIIESPSTSAGVAALAKNNLACTDLYCGCPTHLQEADRCSAEACASYPGIGMFRITRGAVLLAMGDVMSGLELLKESILSNDPMVRKGTAAYWIAMGEADRGNFERAREFVLLAETIAPDAQLSARARGALAAACGSSTKSSSL